MSVKKSLIRQTEEKVDIESSSSDRIKMTYEHYLLYLNWITGRKRQVNKFVMGKLQR